MLAPKIEPIGPKTEPIAMIVISYSSPHPADGGNDGFRMTILYFVIQKE